MTDAVPYVHTAIDKKGRSHHYFRRGARRVPLRGEYGSPRFMSQYWRAREGEPPARPGASKGKIALHRQSRGFVYFLRVKNKVKIGSSKSPLNRVEDLHTGLPDDFTSIVIVPGDASDERYLHGVLRKHRQRREWFTAHRDVLQTMFRCARFCRVVKDEECHGPKSSPV